MGAIIDQLKDKQIQIDRELLGCSHSKLVQYYSSYKSICEGFTITLPEYTHIFGPNKLSFQVWDTKNRARIDALQIFSGLIIFSSIKYQQKVKFLFELFDFNEEGVLAYQNIALMIFNIINASFKVFAINNSIDNSVVQSFLDNYFTQDSEVTSEKLTRWTLKINTVGDFFRSIGQELEQIRQQKRICKLEMADLQNKVENVVYSNYKENIISTPFLSKLKARSKEIPKQQESKRQKLNFNVEWVFGINLQKQNIKYVQVQGEKAANQRIVYVVGKLIVIYYPKLNIQQYYKEHQLPVSAIQLSTHRKMVASAEKGEYPDIHIWDFQTKMLLIKFKALHKNSIQFLTFIKNDHFLVVTSQNTTLDNCVQTPVVIINIQTQEVVMSTYLKHEILGLGIRSYASELPCQFIIMGKRDIITFKQQRNSFSIEIEKKKMIQQILCFAVNELGNYYTCHSQRKLMVWEEGQLSGKLLSYNSECSKDAQQIVCLGTDSLALLDIQDVEILTLNQGIVTRAHRLRLHSNLHFNIDLYHFSAINSTDLMLVSSFGHIFRINNQDNFNSVTYSSFDPIFRLVGPTSFYDDGYTDKLFILCSHLLYVIDRYQKDLVILVKFEQKINKIASNKHSIFLLCTDLEDDSSVVYRLSHSDIKINQSRRFSNKIVDIIANEQQFLAFSQEQISKFPRNQQKYFDRQPQNSMRSNIGRIRNVSMTSDHNIVVVLSYQNETTCINISGQQGSTLEKIQNNEAQLGEVSSYYIDQGYLYPFCANLNLNYIVVGNKNGDLILWQSLAQLITSQSAVQKISFQCGVINQVLLNNNQMVSTGCKDQMVVIFKHNRYLPENEVQNDLRQPQQCQSSVQIDQIPNQPQLKPGMSSQKENKEQNNANLEVDGHFLRESEVQISSLAESNKSDLRELIKDIIDPRDKSSYQHQIQSQKQLNCNKLNLKIEAVLGISTKNPMGVFYIHRYKKEPRLLIDKKYWEPTRKIKNEQLNFATDLLRPIDQTHLDCSRQILYAAGRLCVLRDKKENKQRIYQLHRKRVTCVAVHPQRQIIMSCEDSRPHPVIHIWDKEELSCLSTINTLHKVAVIRGCFSSQGVWLVTLSEVEPNKFQSFQVTNWRDTEIINFVSIYGQIFRGILFNPYNCREITILGNNIIKVYKQESARMILVDQCRIQHDFTCGTYTSSVFGNQVESDVITGSRMGEIGIFICGKYIATKANAHAGSIVCLRIAELFGYKRVLISGGSEGIVKIWDIKFNELTRRDIRQQILAYNNKSYKLEIGISSIDAYQCQNIQDNNRPPTLLLISTTDGSVLQAKITNEFQGYKSKAGGSKQANQLKQKLIFDVSVMFTGPPNNPGTKFEILGEMMITYNCSQRHIQIWNLKDWERISIFSLNHNPSLIRSMNRSSSFLAIYNKEAQSSTIHIFKTQISNNYIKSIQLYSEINLPKGHQYILMATFAQKDNRLALATRQTAGDTVLLYTLKDQNFELSNKIEGGTNRALVLQFSSEGEGLLIGWTDRPLEQINQGYLQKQYIFRCYHVESNLQLPITQFDFKKIDFSRRIRVNYLPCYHLNKKEQQKLSNYSVFITVMAHYDCFLLLGSKNGEIFVVETDYFIKKQKETKKPIRCFIVSDSAITRLDVRDEILYVSSQKGQDIIKVLLRTEQGWEINSIAKDPYNQNISAELLQKNIKQVYSKRKKIQNEQYIESDNKCGVSLQISTILGRNALYKRNNIFVNLKDEIISFSGCNIIIMKKNKKMDQTIIKPDPTPHSTHPQISAIVLGDCKRKLVVGTAEQYPKLLVWDISTNTYLYQIPLADYISVSIIKLSSSSRHAAVIALLPNAMSHLLFIDLDAKKILAVTRLPYGDLNINDLCFVSGKEFKILGCGENFMGEWQYKNGILNYKRYSLDSSQDLSSIKKNGIVFYSVIYIGDMCISSGSDGYLYIWKEGRLAIRQNAHPGSAVLSLYTTPNSRIFASGGANGHVVIWKEWSNLTLHQQGEYPKKTSLNLPIQSISMTLQELVVGDTSGSIWIFPFSDEGSIHYPLMSSFNNQVINSCAFNTSSTRLYVVTEKQGLATFSIFNTKNYSKIREERVDFKSPIIKMLCCKLSNIIFFVLKNSIVVYSLQPQEKESKERREAKQESKQEKQLRQQKRGKQSKDPRQVKVPKDEKQGKGENVKLFKTKLNYKWQPEIMNAALSANERYLAVLIGQSNQQNCKIQIYDLRTPEGIFFKKYKTEEDIPSHIQLIDFSSDHTYFIYQGYNQDPIIIDLLAERKMKLASIESVPQWNDEAIKTSPAVSEIIANYSQDNNVQKLVQLENKWLIATDQLGSVRIFKYPQIQKGLASKIYIEHLNNIYICVMSPDQKILVTVGREDRAIHFWQINYERVVEV